MVSLVVSTVLAAFGAWLASYLGGWQTVLLVVDVALSVAASAVLFALVYKYLPQERLAWRDVWVGSLVTAILFNVGKFAIGYYIGKSAFASVYGAAGSLLVLLLWTYYSAQIFLFGAEFTKSYSSIFPSSAAPPNKQH
jgi:membrane protein